MSAKEESQKLEQEKKRKLEEIFVLQQDLEKLDEEILRYKRMRTLMILDEAKLWTFVETADLLKLMNVVTLIADGKVCEKDVIPRLKELMKHENKVAEKTEEKIGQEKINSIRTKDNTVPIEDVQSTGIDQK